MKADIQDREDVILLVNSFYKTVLKDDLIQPFFSDHMTSSIKDHMPVMYDFWESVLFDKAIYKGNPMVSHIKLNRKMKIEEMHFNQWVRLWEKTTDSLFTGEIAEKAKKKAHLMKAIIKNKINNSDHPFFIQ